MPILVAQSVHATHTTPPTISVSAGHGSGATAGLPLASSQSCPRHVARFTVSPTSVRTT